MKVFPLVWCCRFYAVLHRLKKVKLSGGEFGLKNVESKFVSKDVH